MSSTTPLEVARAVAAVRAALPLTTQRCVLREVVAGDEAALSAYRSDPEVTRFLGHPPLDAAGVGELLERWRGEAGSVSLVAQRLSPATGENDAGESGTGESGAGESGTVPTGSVVGDVRIRFRPSSALSPATTSAVDAALGYAFHPRVHGLGLATECVRAVLDLTLGAAGARRVTARVFAPASPSTRLLTRLGFTRDGVDRAAVLAPDGVTWWDDELWSRFPDGGSVPETLRQAPQKQR